MSSTLNHPGQEGIGLYRGDGEMSPGADVIRDDLSPGLAPHPSEGVQGPPISVPLEAWQSHQEMLEQIGRQVGLMTKPDGVWNTAQGNTDSGGDALGTAASPGIQIYRVAAGMEARMTRLTVNALVAATGVAYTPAVPFQADSAYIEIYEVDSALALGSSGLIDFAPRTSKGQLFPTVFDFQQSAWCRGPKEFALKIVDGPVSSLVLCRYQVELRRARGIA